MMLLEHDAKTILADAGLPVPVGRMVRPAETEAALGDANLPVVIKAQVPVGGRGKAGGIRIARTGDQLRDGLEALLGMTLKGHQVRACRIEQTVDYVGEAYISFTLDPGPANVRVMMSATGGVDIEEAHDDLLAESVDADLAALHTAVDRMSAQLPDGVRGAVRQAAHALASAFVEREAVLLEINPLFITAEGGWVIGDTKLVIDENAFPRQPALQAVIDASPDLYPEAALKLEQGFDFVRLDQDGDIGLVTTGAGLSMQIVDELVARGRRPFNFCDIRTGQFKGDPARLIQVFEWIAAGPSIRSVLINFFAGHTDLGEISKLLVAALAAVPQLRVPVTARLIGRGLESARETLTAAGSPVLIETSLERAIDLAITRADAVETIRAA